MTAGREISTRQLRSQLADVLCCVQTSRDRRANYEMIDAELLVTVVRAAHRREVYDR